MLSGSLHFGSCTPGPFFQALDKGVDWKWLQTTSGFDGYLMVRKDGPAKVENFIGTSMKMSPGPNTAQYFAIQEYLKKAGKDVHALDKNWANLPHPDAMQALIAGQLDGHFATSDFALRLEAEGMKKITSFVDIYGGLYPVGACTFTKTIKEHRQLAQGYADILRKVADWMNANPAKAAQVMSQSTGGKESAKNFEKYLQSPVYKSFTKGANLQAYGKSLYELGTLKRAPTNVNDVYAFPEQAGDKW
jgi:NitT/TauT family transport system substrate-binding protein